MKCRLISIVVIVILNFVITIKLTRQKCSNNFVPVKELLYEGGSEEKSWDESCDKEVSKDFAERDKQEEYKDCKSKDSWGPRPNIYGRIKIPANCNSEKFMQKRVVELIKHVVAKKWNYCHHHSPSWVHPTESRIVIDPENIAQSVGGEGVCSKAGLDPKNPNVGWNGIDCTHYTSWVYNFGFGAPLVTLTGDQACGEKAPGRVLPYTIEEADKFLPGDLLFIAANSKSNPLVISHGILWTGITMQDSGEFSYDNLLKLVPKNQQKAVIEDVKKFKSEGKKIYVISDSHHAGPNYRLFAGWWTRGFVFARRLINPDNTLPTTKSKAKFSENKCTVEK